MKPILFRCPVNGNMVQHLLADPDDLDFEQFELVQCVSCTRVHLVNPRGRLLGGDDGDRE